MNTSPNTDKDSVFHFLKKLNSDVQTTVAEMKSDFEKNPSSANIKDRFLVIFLTFLILFDFYVNFNLKKWKSKYSEIVNNALKEHIFNIDMDPSFDFKEFLNKITEEF